MKLKIFAILFFIIPFDLWAVDFNAKPLLETASDLLQNNKLNEAITTYHTIYNNSQDKQDQALALMRMADILAMFLDQPDKAIFYYKQIVEKYPQQQIVAVALFRVGMLLYEQHYLSQSKYYFEKFIQYFPDSAQYFTASFMLKRINSELKQQTKPQPKLYPDLDVKNASNIRVALGKERKIEVFFPGPVSLTTPQGTQKLQAGTYNFEFQGKKLYVNGRLMSAITTWDAQQGFIFKGKSYSGILKTSAEKDKLLFINFLPLEDYLLGVVPREMPPSWQLEALKSQAVAARSYAYYLNLKSKDKKFDVSATTASQVYGGNKAGNERTRQAVQQTLGQIMVVGRRPILTYFHSHSGGVLEDDANVWSADLPYYQVKDDSPSLQAKNLSWSYSISASKLTRILAGHGFRINKIKDVKAEQLSDSGRLVNVRINTDFGPVVLKASQLRLWIGASKMKSTLCTIQKQGENFVFTGRGYGHGVGLSQWGAQGMARQGKDYKQILSHYYAGSQIKKIY